MIFPVHKVKFYVPFWKSMSFYPALVLFAFTQTHLDFHSRYLFLICHAYSTTMHIKTYCIQYSFSVGMGTSFFSLGTFRHYWAFHTLILSLRWAIWIHMICPKISGETVENHVKFRFHHFKAYQLIHIHSANMVFNIDQI